MEDRAERMVWFKREVLANEPALRRFLRRRGTPLDDIDDLVSEALVRAYSAEDWRRVTDGTQYLFRICKNLIVDKVRRAKIVAFENVADWDALDLVDGAPSAETLMSTRDELRVLQAAIEDLPPKCRQVFLLRRVQELPPLEVARRLGLSVRTVEHHVAKALAVLARTLSEADPATGSKTVLAWRRRQTL